MQRCLKICQDEILKWFKNKAEQNKNLYYSCKEIEQDIKISPRNIKRALRQLVAYGEIDITFKLEKKGGLRGGFTPCYRAKIEPQNNN